MSTAGKALACIGQFSEWEISLFEQEVKYRHFNKGDFILKSGAVAKSVFFTLNGAIYQYYAKLAVEQVILNLHADGDWFLDNKSFISQSPSETYIVAYEASNLIELHIESIHRLITQSESFFRLNKLLEFAAQRVDFFDNKMSPVEKYLFILEKKPQLIQKFPLKMIASYLKVTPETLSRVREKIAKTGIRS